MAKQKNPFAYDPTTINPYVYEPGELEGLQYRFELTRLLNDYQKDRLDKNRLDSELNSLMDRAGVSSPETRNSILNSTPATVKIRPVEPTPKQEEEYEGTLNDYISEIGQAAFNFFDLGVRRLGTAATGAGYFFDSDTLKEVGADLKEYAEQGLAEDGYKPPRTTVGKVAEQIVSQIPEFALGGGLFKVATAAGGVVGGILAGQVGMQAYAALSVGGETAESWKNHPAWQQASKNLSSLQAKDLEEKISTKATDYAVKNRALYITGIDALSGFRVPGGLFSNILFDAATEYPSEFGDTWIQGLATNNAIHDVLQEEGLLGDIPENLFQLDAASWIKNADNLAQAHEGGKLGFLSAGAISTVITPTEQYLQRKADAEQEQVTDPAKELEQTLKNQNLELRNQAEIERIQAAREKRIRDAQPPASETPDSPDLITPPQPEGETEPEVEDPNVLVDINPNEPIKKGMLVQYLGKDSKYSFERPRKVLKIATERDSDGKRAKFAWFDSRTRIKVDSLTPYNPVPNLPKTAQLGPSPENAPFEEEYITPPVTQDTSQYKPVITDPQQPDTSVVKVPLAPEAEPMQRGDLPPATTSETRTPAEIPFEEENVLPPVTQFTETQKLQERKAKKQKTVAKPKPVAQETKKLKAKKAAKKETPIPFEEENVLPPVTRDQGPTVEATLPVVQAAPAQPQAKPAAQPQAKPAAQPQAQAQPQEPKAYTNTFKKGDRITQTLKSGKVKEGVVTLVNPSGTINVKWDESGKVQKRINPDKVGRKGAAPAAVVAPPPQPKPKAAPKSKPQPQAAKPKAAPTPTVAEPPLRPDSDAGDIGIFSDEDRPMDEDEFMVDPRSAEDFKQQQVQQLTNRRSAKRNRNNPTVLQEVVIDEDLAKQAKLKLKKEHKGKTGVVVGEVDRRGQKLMQVRFKDGKTDVFPESVLRITDVKQKGYVRPDRNRDQVSKQAEGGSAQRSENRRMQAEKDKLDARRAKIEEENRKAAEAKQKEAKPVAPPVAPPTPVEAEPEATPAEATPPSTELSKGAVVTSSREGDVGQGVITSISKDKGSANVRFYKDSKLKKGIPLSELTRWNPSSSEAAADPPIVESPVVTKETKTERDFRPVPNVTISKGSLVMRKDGSGDPKEVKSMRFDDGQILLTFTDLTRGYRDEWVVIADPNEDSPPLQDVLQSERFGLKYGGDGEAARLNQAQLSIVIDHMLKNFFPGIDRSRVLIFENLADMQEFVPSATVATEGAATSDGYIALRADAMLGKNLRNAIARGIRVFLHEGIGHDAIMRYYGDKYGEFTERVYRDRKAEIDRWYDQNYAMSPTPLSDTDYHSPYRRVSEWLAQNFAENGVQSVTLVDKLILFGQGLVGSKKMTDAQIVKTYQDVLKQAKQLAQDSYRPKPRPAVDEEESVAASAPTPAPNPKLQTDRNYLEAVENSPYLNLTFQSENPLMGLRISQPPNIVDSRFRLPWIDTAISIAEDGLIANFSDEQDATAPLGDLANTLKNAMRQVVQVSTEVRSAVRSNKPIDVNELANKYDLSTDLIKEIAQEASVYGGMREEMSAVERENRLLAIMFPQFFSRRKNAPDTDLFDPNEEVNVADWWKETTDQWIANTPRIIESVLTAPSQSEMPYPSGIVEETPYDAPYAEIRAKLSSEDLIRYEHQYENVILVAENLAPTVRVGTEEFSNVYDESAEGHFYTDNVMAHFRATQFEHEGSPAVLVHEIQSSMQQGAKSEQNNLVVDELPDVLSGKLSKDALDAMNQQGAVVGEAVKNAYETVSNQIVEDIQFQGPANLTDEQRARGQARLEAQQRVLKDILSVLGAYNVAELGVNEYVEPLESEIEVLVKSRENGQVKLYTPLEIVHQVSQMTGYPIAATAKNVLQRLSRGEPEIFEEGGMYIVQESGDLNLNKAKRVSTLERYLRDGRDLSDSTIVGANVEFMNISDSPESVKEGFISDYGQNNTMFEEDYDTGDYKEVNLRDAMWRQAGSLQRAMLDDQKDDISEVVRFFVDNTTQYRLGWERGNFATESAQFLAGKFDYDLNEAAKGLPVKSNTGKTIHQELKKIQEERRKYLQLKKLQEVEANRFRHWRKLKDETLDEESVKARFIAGGNFNTMGRDASPVNPWLSSMKSSWWVDAVLNNVIMRYAERGIKKVFFPNANQVITYTGGKLGGQQALYDRNVPNKLKNLLKREPFLAYGFDLDTDVNPTDVDPNLLTDVDYQQFISNTPSRLTMTKLEIPEKFITEFAIPLRELIEKETSREGLTPEEFNSLTSKRRKLFDLMSENYQGNQRYESNKATGLSFSTFSDLQDYYDRVRPKVLTGSTVRNTFLLANESDTPQTMTDAYALYDMNHRAWSHNFDLEELKLMYEAEKIALQAAHKQYTEDSKFNEAAEIEERLATNFSIREFIKRNEGNLETNLAEYAGAGALRRSAKVPTRNEFLQLGSPVNTQPLGIQRALRGYDTAMTGEEILKEVSYQSGGSEPASMELLQRGIRGVVNEDGYVLFNDYDPAIQEQYFLSENFQEVPINRLRTKFRVKNIIRGVRNFFNPLEPLGDMADAYRVIKNRAAGVIGQIERDMGAVARTFQDLKEQEIVQVFEAFTTTDEIQRQNILSILSPEIRANVENARQLIHETGLALVSRGLLSRQAFDTHDGSYLPRKYLLYLLNDSDRTAFSSGSGKTLSKMEYLKGRTDTDPYVREFFWGEIKDPEFLTARALIQPNRDMALLDMFEELAQNPEFVQQDSLVELDYADVINEVIQENDISLEDLGVLGAPRSKVRKVSSYFLKKEADRIATQVAANLDGDRRKFVELLADKLDERAELAIGNPIDMEQWRRVPTDKRYGAFQGMLLRKEIYDDLLDSIEITSGMGETLDKLTNFWKWGKVAANVPSWFRNWLSNTMMMHLAGMPLYRLDYRIKAVKEFLDQGERYQTYFNLGMVKSTFSANELRKIDRDALDRILQTHLQNQDENKVVQSLLNLKRMGTLLGTALMDKTGAIYQALEVIDKLAFAMYMEDTKGMSPDMALIEANKPLFDYGEVSPELRRIRRHPMGIPFATWLYKATPFFADIATSPSKWHRIAPLIALQYGLYYALTDGWDEEEHDKFEAILPEWIRDKGRFGIALPNRDFNENVQIADMEYILPWASHYMMVKSLASGQYDKFLKEIGAFGSPIISLGVGAVANYDVFRRREIVDEDDPLEYKYMDYGEFIYNNLVPSMLATNGAPRKLIDASFAAAGSDLSLGFFSGESSSFDRKGEPKATLGQAALNLAGVGVYGIDLKNEMRNRQSDIEKRRTKAEVEYKNSLRALRNSGRSTKDREKDIRDLYIEKLEKLKEEARVLRRGSLAQLERTFN